MFLDVLGVPHMSVVPSKYPTKVLECRYKWEVSLTILRNLQNRCFWHMVDSKPKGYFWGVCVVNMSLEIKTFDQYLHFGRKELRENASKWLCEKKIFGDFAHFSPYFPLHFTLKIYYLHQNRDFLDFWLYHVIWYKNVFPEEFCDTFCCF